MAWNCSPETMRGRNALLALGVQGKNTAEMSEYARHAEELAPDALIAMPPSAGKSQSDYGEYFRALAKLTKLPVIIQASGGARGLAMHDKSHMLLVNLEYEEQDDLHTIAILPSAQCRTFS